MATSIKFLNESNLDSVHTSTPSFFNNSVYQDSACRKLPPLPNMNLPYPVKTCIPFQPSSFQIADSVRSSKNFENNFWNNFKNRTNTNQQPPLTAFLKPGQEVHSYMYDQGYNNQHSIYHPYNKIQYTQQPQHAQIPETNNVLPIFSEKKNLVQIPKDIEITITTQPASFQIANYNVHPAPILALNVPLPSGQLINVTLIESVTNTEVSYGFQTGFSRTLYPGSKMIYFTGLKLSKMGKIKSDLHDKQLDTFYLQFNIADRIITSEPFKVVSSCSRLPDDIKEAVRPPKRIASKHSVEDQEDQDERNKSLKKSKK